MGCILVGEVAADDAGVMALVDREQSDTSGPAPRRVTADDGDDNGDGVIPTRAQRRE